MWVLGYVVEVMFLRLLWEEVMRGVGMGKNNS